MEPRKRLPQAHVFIDGQNLAFAARDVFGHPLANYDILALAQAACKAKGWDPARISFYTGVPSRTLQARQSRFWQRKLATMRHQGVETIPLPLRYHTTCKARPDGTLATFHQAQEKGVDVRIAVDIICSAHDVTCDAVLLFSQDNDLREALLGARQVAKRAGRNIDFACAFPCATETPRGITGIPVVPISREMYGQCLDPVDYDELDARHASLHEVEPERAARMQEEMAERARAAQRELQNPRPRQRQHAGTVPA